MGSKAEKYRRKAEEAEKMAAETRDQVFRESCVESAKRWRKMADEADRDKL